MKIIIIGAGISGLTTYLFSKKHLSPASEHSITVYEAYDTATLRDTPFDPDQESPKDDPNFLVTAIGNALGVSSNGLNVIRRLDPKLLKEIIARGCPVHTWSITNARGWKLVDVNLANSKSKGKKEDLSGIMISRQALWECLRGKVPDEVIRTRKVVNVTISADGRNSVLFADGTSDDADLIIGADGLRSIVRTAMFRDDKAKGKDYITPHYEGLAGVGSFIPSSVLRDSKCIPGTMNLVFGPNGFFGYGYITSSAMADGKSTSEIDITPGSTGAWWSTFNLTDCPDTRKFDRPAALAALTKRHSGWKNPSVHQIVKYVSESPKGIEDMYPTLTTPELPTWEKNCCILVGDAAHALQPSSGQGTSQACEDAEALTLLLKYYLESAGEGEERTAINLAAKNYVKMREPRLHEIYVYTQRMSKRKGDMGFFMEMLVYLAIYLMSFFHDTYNEKLLNYDVPTEVEKVLKD